MDAESISYTGNRLENPNNDGRAATVWQQQ